MLDDLDRTDWSRLHHAHGAATDVPKLIRALASEHEEVRKQALDELYGNIWHQGTVYEATAHAVPFLLELVAQPTTPARADLLALLASIAEGSSYLEVHATDDSELFASEREAPGFAARLAAEREWVAAAHAAAREGVDLYLALLNGADPLLRAGAAHILGCFPERRLAPTLIAAAARETHALTQAGILLGLAKLKDRTPATRRFLKTTLQSATDIRPAYAAAVGLVRLDGVKAPPAALALIRDLGEDAWIGETFLTGLPWDWSAEAGAEQLWQELQDAGVEDAATGPPADLAVYLPSVPAWLEELRAATEGHVAAALAGILVHVAFPGGQALPALPTWSSLQCTVVQAIVEAEVAWAQPHALGFLEERGVEPQRARRGRAGETRQALRQLLAKRCR